MPNRNRFAVYTVKCPICTAVIPVTGKQSYSAHFKLFHGNEFKWDSARTTDDNKTVLRCLECNTEFKTYMELAQNLTTHHTRSLEAKKSPNVDTHRTP